ncbi:hypothetical protein BWK63_08215 [Flavobacterium covae]|uniref:Uncharacterized protein n=3 Tax=Flavobacterium TaxID=237 RepID=A0AA94JQX6_9FLAO|nr:MULTISPECIES: hypothetical protein [Flavobacterium]OXA81246.1 hypothetical protein B0A56_06085 [Flavobacterium columnare NBRC 100251 = ATCC 23463]MCH4830702.1 hypothetical protein [Flavobacterium columnare]MCH4833361.1 hypothetical protein [Flavobacterium columnare]OWP80968.1 hypothetical protein BWK63_08215 [Flavobacterium covae]POR21526.1 hypothetical protein BWK57_09700 [Flavobacterium columnare]
METKFELIEKELIENLHFPTEQVLEELKDRTQLKAELERAQVLGNVEHAKIKIYFEDDVSKKVVDTTVWGVTDQEIILKKGVTIPIHRIYKIM